MVNFETRKVKFKFKNKIERVKGRWLKKKKLDEEIREDCWIIRQSNRGEK